GVRSVYAEYVVAKGLDSREILKAPPGCIEERFVKSEGVGIAMNVGHGFPEICDLVAQREPEDLKPVGSVRGAVGAGERFRVTKILAFYRMIVEPGIGLGDEHDGDRIAVLRNLERFSHPRDVGISAGIRLLG